MISLLVRQEPASDPAHRSTSTSYISLTSQTGLLVRVLGSWVGSGATSTTLQSSSSIVLRTDVFISSATFSGFARKAYVPYPPSSQRQHSILRAMDVRDGHQGELETEGEVWDAGIETPEGHVLDRCEVLVGIGDVVVRHHLQRWVSHVILPTDQ